MSYFDIIGNKQGGKIRVHYNETIDIPNNTSIITGYLESSNTWYNGNYTYAGTLKIAGKTLLDMSETVGGHNNWIDNTGTFFKIGNTDYSVVVPHNQDGTGNATIEANIRTYELGGYFQWSASGSKSITLQTIPRKSSVVVGEMIIEDFPTIRINAASSSFTHTVNWYFGNLSGVVANKTNQTQITNWQIPKSFYSQIPNANIGEGQFECITYNNGVELGKTYTKFIAQCDESKCKPTLNPVFKDINPKTVGLTGNNQNLIRFFSNVELIANASARNNATITGVWMRNGTAETVNADKHTFNAIQEKEFVITAYDSRGYKVSVTINPNIIDYIKPTCNLWKQAPSTVGDFDYSIDGIFYNGSFGAVDNTISLFIRYKEETAETYNEWIALDAPRVKDNTYKLTSVISGLEYKKVYIFQAKVIDLLTGEVLSAELTYKSIPVFDWGEGDFNFNVPVFFKGSPILPIDLIYPVGSIYMSVNAVNPQKLFGGTWEKLKNCFLFAADDKNYPVNSTGGSSTQSLKQENLPPHQHVYMTNIQHGDGASVPNSESLTSGLQVGGRRRYTDVTNSQPVFDDKPPVFKSEAFSIMPPYLAVNIWKRTK